MKSIFVLFSSVLVVVLIVFIVVNAPVDKKEQITVNTIELERLPKPVLQSDPAADHVLEFFPEPKDSLPLEAPPEITTVPQSQTPQSGQKENPKNVMIHQKHNLLALIHDWVYVTYSQIGSTKLGHIHDTRNNVMIKIFEGKIFDNGVEVTKLSPDRALLKLGEATFPLQRAEKPSFFEEIEEKPRALTPEEQVQAYEYYMKRWGHKFQEYSKGYQPPPGMQNPQPVSPEMKKKGLEQYKERYAKKFKRNEKEYRMPALNAETQREMYKKYWQKYHPDREMPDFDNIYKSTLNESPGSRAQ